MTENTDHITKYQLGKLSSLLDTFEILLDDKVTGKMKSNEDYPNILLKAAGKASLALRAIIHLCASGFPDAALMLSRQIYEQSIILCFFEEIKRQADFEKCVEDYYNDYYFQMAKYNKWQAETITKNPNEIEKWNNQIESIRQKAHHKIEGDYWWTGHYSFTKVVYYLMNSASEKLAAHMAILHLLYMRACKDVHAGALGNSLRLGSDPEMCGVDNTAKTTGHGLPLFFAVSAFNLIVFIVFNNFIIDNRKLVDDFERLIDLYAIIDHEEP